jgi:hypothetical protein
VQYPVRVMCVNFSYVVHLNSMFLQICWVMFEGAASMPFIHISVILSKIAGKSRKLNPIVCYDFA